MSQEQTTGAPATTTAIHDRIAHCAALYIDAKRVLANGLLLAKRADELNNSKHLSFFRDLQRDYGALTFVRVAALFEDSKNNRTHSLPHMVRFLADHEVTPTPRAKLLLQAFGGENFESFARSFCHKPLSDHLANIKTGRDRAIAHVDRAFLELDDSVLAQSAVSYDECAALIEHARRVLIVAKALYLAVSVGEDDEPALSFRQHPMPLSRAIGALVPNKSAKPD